MQYYPNLFKRKRYKWTEMVLFREGVGKCCHLYISHHSRIRLYAARILAKETVMHIRRLD